MATFGSTSFGSTRPWTSAAVALGAVLAVLVALAPAAWGQEATGSIVGTVTDAETGDPIEGICVDVIEEDWARHGGDAVTAADGTYRVDDVPVGDNWWVGFFDCTEAGIYREQFHEGHRFAFQADLVSVQEGEETVVDEQLTAGGSVRGTITSAVTGDPLSGMCVIAWPVESVGQVFHQAAFSEDDGTYILHGLNPDEYYLSFNWCLDEDDEDPDHQRHWYDGAATSDDATAVVVEQRVALTGIDAVLPGIAEDDDNDDGNGDDNGDDDGDEADDTTVAPTPTRVDTGLGGTAPSGPGSGAGLALSLVALAAVAVATRRIVGSRAPARE